MSGVDVLAVLRDDANEALMFRDGSCGREYVARKTRESAEALAAVAELVAADRELDSAGVAYSAAATGKGRNEAWSRVLNARVRRAAALAAFGGSDEK